MAAPRKIIVIGGSAAGPKAAAKARRLDQAAEITIIQKGGYLSMASCGYPYYVGGYFDDRNQLLATPYGVVRDPQFFMHAKGIQARTHTEVTRIDPAARTVTCRSLESGETATLAYDKLVIATGAVPRMPPVPGIDLAGVSTLQSMPDADYLRSCRDACEIREAVVVGGGLIGIETCEALQLAGISITVVEMLPQILMFLDWELAKLLENHVRSKAANVITDNAVAGFLGDNGRLRAVKLASGTELPCELAVVAVGVSPNTALAREAGLALGGTGGIAVDEHMQTSDPDIYAVGDCVEVADRVAGGPTLAPYGDLANLQGRVAGQNVVLGNVARFPGTVHTGICKVFDWSAGSTGLSETRARRIGMNDIVTVVTSGPDKPSFMGAKPLVTKMVAEAGTGRLLGVQCVGPGDVSRQIGQAAMALQGRLTVADLVNADLPYAPPFSQAIDNLVMTAHVLDNKMRGYLTGISTRAVHEKLESGETPFFLDMRESQEFADMRLGIGETQIPYGALRRRLGDLPEDKSREIICYCKLSLRGYEAALLLRHHGWTDVKVMEGGILAWPYPREK